LFLLFSGGICSSFVTNAIDPAVLKSDDLFQNRPIQFPVNRVLTVLVSQNFGNIVQIRQIGNYNNVQANLTANNIELDITQKETEPNIFE
jgi:hypothetical protein